MIRPTHFVILFAVFLCAYAAPTAPESSAVEAPAKAAESPEQLVPSPKGEGEPDKSDLDTDPTTYYRYSYYGPRWGYYNSGFSGRTIGWGFGRTYDLIPYGLRARILFQ